MEVLATCSCLLPRYSGNLTALSRRLRTVQVKWRAADQDACRSSKRAHDVERNHLKPDIVGLLARGETRPG